VTEKALSQAIFNYAQQRGWLAYRTYDSRRSAPGFPDLVLVRGEVTIFAELKNVKGKLTEDQEQWSATLLAAGQNWYLWRPADLGDVLKLLL
jgi:Holliday junction resolvase